ncbi:MAG: hypothetical protein ACI865_001452 [Flavobacteriaceae bacterium]|jgi:hypothetical protein
MKNSIKISITAFVIGISFMSAGQYTKSSISSIQKTSIDQQVSVSAKLINRTVYFKLLMQNETKDGVYSLVREYTDGSFEFVGYKSITPNDINQPLLYCLKDNHIPSRNFTYILYRITCKSEVVAEWTYDADERSIVPDREDNLTTVISLK